MIPVVRLPPPRGPLSEVLLAELALPPHRLRSFSVPRGPEVLAEEDFQLSLYLCYELHYRGLAGVDERWEWDPSLLELLAERRVTVECCPSCNVVLGAVPSYEEHPIRTLVSHGIPVTLGTDDPVQIGTTIGREYAIVSALGFSPQELLESTANGIQAAFTSPERREELLAELREHSVPGHLLRF